MGEQNGVLQTSLIFDCKIMTSIERKEYISNKEEANNITENEKSVGLGIFVNAISVHMILVLDI